MEKPLQVFCCYARIDQEYLQALKKHLMVLQREKLIEIKADIDITPGAEWEREINHHLEKAQIILLLISADFIASDYCYEKEMRQALARHKRGTACVVPVIIRPSSWQINLFSVLQALPKDAKPVSRWENVDEAYTSITEGIRSVVQSFIGNQTEERLPAAEQNQQNVLQFVDDGDLSSGSKPPEEVSENAPYHVNPPVLTKKVRMLWLPLVLIVLLALVGGGGSLYYRGYYLPVQQHAVATATAHSVGTVTARNNALLTAGLVANNPYPPYTGTLQLKDTLQQNTDKQDWITLNSPNFGSCLFIEGAYHAAVVQNEQFNYCSNKALTFSDFAYQAQVTILKGGWGGLSFRSPGGGSLYYFQIQTQGYYELDVNKNHHFLGPVVSGNSPLIKAGYGQTNLLGVVARGNSFDLYVNLQHIAHGSDTTFSSGLVGVIANYGASSTEVMFHDAEVWKL